MFECAYNIIKEKRAVFERSEKGMKFIMAQKGMDFRHKEVICVNDGRRLGFVQDVTADLKSGTITSIIVPGSSKPFSFLSSNNDIVITWDKIKCIGDNVILVDL